MHNNYFRLKNTDETSFLVFAPPLLPYHRKLYIQYLELKAELVGLIKAVGDISPDLFLDPYLYPSLEAAYKTIAVSLVQAGSAEDIDCDRLDPLSRHHFFVATQDGEEYGLSGLEQILGLSYPSKTEGSQKDSGVIVPTTGDAELDLMTALTLTFKRNAIPLARTYAIQDLSKMVGHASTLLRGREAIEELQQQRDREAFNKNQVKIDEAFQSMGVNIPF